MDSPITAGSLRAHLVPVSPGIVGMLARLTGAIKRFRKVPDAMTLLHMLLAYVASDYSIKDTAALFGDGLGPSFCAASLHARLAKSGDWLERLLSLVLTGDHGDLPVGAKWIRLVDATSLSGPGATGTDWRVHALVDQASGLICSLRVTAARVGESAALHPLCASALLIFDRGYSHAANIHRLAAAAAGYVVRVGPQTIRICDIENNTLKLDRLAERVVAGEPFDMAVRVPLRLGRKGKNDWHLVKGVKSVRARLVGMRLPSGEVMWLLSNAGAEHHAGEVAALYRFRWQVELVFKRLKSLTGLHALKSREGPTARPWILGKLLLAAMAQRLVRPAGPCDKPAGGYAAAHRHSAWSRLRVAYDAVCQIILGDAVLRLVASEENLRRLMNTPRKRLQQPPLAAMRSAWIEG
jgi:hypothetical protein